MLEKLETAKHRFIQSWGEMGPQWGINRTMAQLHALLMISEKPLSTDDVMEELHISRGNANMNLRALADWGLARRVIVKGDRKEFFQSEKDVWTMVCRIARERKKREIEPVMETMQECLTLAGKDRSGAHFRQRVGDLLELVKTLDAVLGKLAQQEKSAVVPRVCVEAAFLNVILSF
jgi:DNA-binding transcriptional regulator GbsR (MarR family)